MKNLLFVYPYMMVGGSTTALLGILNSIDYSEYSVDLILNKNEGSMLKYIPAQVNILPCAARPLKRYKKLFLMAMSGYVTKSVVDSLKYKKRIGFVGQDLAYAKNATCRRLSKHYEAAISGLEGWANAYVNECVDADVKISWIHTDYCRMKFIPQIDLASFSKSNYVVCVSTILANQLKAIMPSIQDKIITMENIISPRTIKQMAAEPIDDSALFATESFRILTVSRLTFSQKRLDRAINVLSKLIDKGYKVDWYIIGDGEDKESIINMAESKGVGDHLHIFGLRINPYPYYRYADLFVLTSDVEGKPVTVSEAQILGTPVLVTRYEAADQQIRDGVDGIIAENSEDDLLLKLETVLSRPECLVDLKKNLKNLYADNNILQISQFEKMCGGRYDK